MDPLNTISCGDTFNTHDEFVRAIQTYAHKNGFSVRLGKIKYKVQNKENIQESKEIRKRTILCSRAGEPEQKGVAKVRNRASQRCNCGFYVRASLNSDNNLWCIINLNLSHNHSMVEQAHRHFMLSERSIPDDVKERIILLRKAGVNVPVIRNILKEEFGEHVTWVYSDLYNFIHNIEGTKQKEFDAEEFLNLLDQIKQENENFFYCVHINEITQRLERVIWMYPEQRVNYSRFCDVIVFDNTYKTNRFQMPFGIFTGVNNFGQSVCFAGILMIEENEETFRWIFTKFLDMVNHHAPLVLLTDDDRAIANAYEKVFQPLGTKHRLCQWHLLKNVIKNLMAKLGSKWQQFISQLYACLNELDPNEFHNSWENLKRSYPDSCQYLSRMERNKEKWAACYNQDIFMADMVSTQRGESMNNLMKGYMDASTSLAEFISAFESALKTREESFEFQEYKQNNYNVLYKAAGPFEQQAASLLTSYSLKKTQEQIIQSYSYKCEEMARYMHIINNIINIYDINYLLTDLFILVIVIPRHLEFYDIIRRILQEGL